MHDNAESDNRREIFFSYYGHFTFNRETFRWMGNAGIKRVLINTNVNKY